jgi:Protein of unknown function, DUF481
MSKKNRFYEAVGGLLQSSEQGIALQTLLGGGVGRYLKNTNQASIQLLGGVGWQDTTYQHANTPIQHQNTAAALIYVDARLFKFSKTNLDATAGILPAVTRVEFALMRTLRITSSYVKGGAKPDHCGGVKVGQWRVCWV